MSLKRVLQGCALLAGLVVVAMVLRLGIEWRQALLNVDAMIVTPVVLPEPTIAVAADSAPQSATGDAGTALPPATLPQTAPETADVGEMNILLLGTDMRGDESGPPRTDALVLVHIDSKDNRVSMLSLPRDLWVEIPGYGEARINAAYPIGEREIGPGGGAALIKRTVGNLLGIPVHHFVLINFEGFESVIDMLGGIYVDVPTPIYDPAYPTLDYGTIEVRFRAGRQLLSGERALIYARTRHADSDFGRNQRQQQVLMAIFERVRERGLLEQLTSLDDYTGALRDYIRTDLSKSDMLGLANFARGLESDAIRRFAIDAEMIVDLRAPATFAADPQELTRLVSQMTGAPSAQAGGEDDESIR